MAKSFKNLVEKMSPQRQARIGKRTAQMASSWRSTWRSGDMHSRWLRRSKKLELSLKIFGLLIGLVGFHIYLMQIRFHAS